MKTSVFEKKKRQKPEKTLKTDKSYLTVYIPGHPDRLGFFPSHVYSAQVWARSENEADRAIGTVVVPIEKLLPANMKPKVSKTFLPL